MTFPPKIGHACDRGHSAAWLEQIRLGLYQLGLKQPVRSKPVNGLVRTEVEQVRTRRTCSRRAAAAQSQRVTARPPRLRRRSPSEAGKGDFQTSAEPPFPPETYVNARSTAWACLDGCPGQ
ncbi:hypothetical protein CHELA17_62218 [Chelatococcus asaccharovorans]|nr:hypothetical protein CHELA17_62218 [Chelatococcus asaccharovorans]